jgi:hypothetical protein
MTKGTDGLTIEGYSEDRAANLRELLRENRFVPTPVRRVYIPKANGKMRPLGIPMGHAYCTPSNILWVSNWGQAGGPAYAEYTPHP